MTNIIEFPVGNKATGFAEKIFDMALEEGKSVEEIITDCLTLVNVLTIVRPELVFPVRRVACEIIGECDDHR